MCFLSNRNLFEKLICVTKLITLHCRSYFCLSKLTINHCKMNICLSKLQNKQKLQKLHLCCKTDNNSLQKLHLINSVLKLTISHCKNICLAKLQIIYYKTHIFATKLTNYSSTQMLVDYMRSKSVSPTQAAVNSQLHLIYNRLS